MRFPPYQDNKTPAFFPPLASNWNAPSTRLTTQGYPKTIPCIRISSCLEELNYLSTCSGDPMDNGLALNIGTAFLSVPDRLSWPSDFASMPFTRPTNCQVRSPSSPPAATSLPPDAPAQPSLYTRMTRSVTYAHTSSARAAPRPPTGSSLRARRVGGTPGRTSTRR